LALLCSNFQLCAVLTDFRLLQTCYGATGILLVVVVVAKEDEFAEPPLEAASGAENAELETTKPKCT